MARWDTFAAEAPELAETGKQRCMINALHSWPAPFPADGFDDSEWYIEGRALAVEDPAIQAIVAEITTEKPERGRAFELDIARVLRKHRVDGRIVYDRWPG